MVRLDVFGYFTGLRPLFPSFTFYKHESLSRRAGTLVATDEAVPRWDIAPAALNDWGAASEIKRIQELTTASFIRNAAHLNP